MTRARVDQIVLSETPWYHVVNRCVRRAFLCGVDDISGQNYEHRREWIEQRIMQLASVFTIDIASFAIMNNHYHIVLRVDKAKADALSVDEVLNLWTQLFAGNPLVQRYLENPAGADTSMLESVNEFAEVYRERLYDISWFMRVLNESIARMANKEDGVKGRFWEGRFKSQALLDEQAVISVMAYVDLNPVRAGMANGLTDSDYTSIQRRVEGRYEEACLPGDKPSMSLVMGLQVDQDYKGDELAQVFLERLSKIPFSGLMQFAIDTVEANIIPFSKEDYFEFVDYLGRAVHPNKRGVISEEVPTIMEVLNLSTKMVDRFCNGRLLSVFGDAIGSPAQLEAHCVQKKTSHCKGMHASRDLYVARAL
ncbi:MAG: transposase [Pseudomonadota bacterium]|nr:transposase [Pseudomonadota bacterium]